MQNKTDHSALIRAMQEFCTPEAQEKRLRAKWSKAADICAMHFQYHTPAPDGTFEILFMTGAEADQRLKKGDSMTTMTKISFAAGLELAARPDCSGGSSVLKEVPIIRECMAPEKLESPGPAQGFH